ncbi:MAG: thermonuclease family protein [Myxococcaceae bacterium]
MRGLLLFAVVFGLAGCETTRAGRRYSRDEAASALKQFERVSLEIGEFELAGAGAVIDGDTIKVKGLDNSMRLLAIDTEETFKHDDERQAYAAGFEQYKKAMRGDNPRPVKMATPLGEEAKKYAEGFFEGVRTVRLVRDHPGEIRDYYNRYLAYAFALKNGEWLNYNLECVRAGMSPYFNKYGRSRRFHKEFLSAQAEAREAGRGIWDPKKEHYDDYDQRIAWWTAREQAITRFEKRAQENEDYLVLTRWDALLRLERNVGKTVTVLGAVSQVKLGDKGPTLVKLSRTRGNDFDVVFFDKDVFLSSGILQNRGEYVQIRGVVVKHFDRYRKLDRLQLVVSLPGQVVAPSKELDDLLFEELPVDPHSAATEGE